MLSGTLLSQALSLHVRFPFRNASFTRDGDEGTRTPDLLRAREALSHLSYIPSLKCFAPGALHFFPDMKGGPFWTRTRDLALIRGTL